MLGYARAGDTVALDRLGRSLSGIVQTVKTLVERGIVLRSLREWIDTSTSTGRMVLGIFPRGDCHITMPTTFHASSRPPVHAYDAVM